MHRLDKDTSGVILVAKNDAAHRALQAQFKARTVRKTYWALVYGLLSPTQGEIVAPIGRDPRDRKRMAVVQSGGRPAATRYETLDSYRIPRQANVSACWPAIRSPAAPTRFAFTWRTSSTPSSAIQSTAPAGRPQYAVPANSCTPNDQFSAARHRRRSRVQRPAGRGPGSVLELLARKVKVRDEGVYALSIVVFGSVNMDLVAHVPRLPAPGETLTGRSFFTAPGGKGGSQAVAYTRLGAAPRMMDQVGDDAFGGDVRGRPGRVMAWTRPASPIQPGVPLRAWRSSP